MQITLLGRRWFEKTNGNTYHSGIAYIDGKEVVKIDFRYGYGNQWEWELSNEMDKAGLLPGMERFSNGSHESIHRYCERMGHALVYNVTDVNRKKELAF